jgi:soluble lytic murein transglycosylase-like protein
MVIVCQSPEISVMHNSSSQGWHEAFASVDFSVHKQVLSSAVFGCAGMFALALSASHFLPRPSADGNLMPAYSASQPAANEGLEANTTETIKPQAACVSAQPAGDGSALASHPVTRKQLVAHVEGTYKVPAPLAQKIVDTTIAVSRENDMDPFLALGIIASESSFNHKAESSYGAAGLMQIHAPSHQALLEEIGLRERNPRTVQRLLTARVKLNVTAGIRIYKAYEKQYGSPVKALQAYNGARSDTSHRYARKVLSMREDFRKVAMPDGPCA